MRRWWQESSFDVCTRGNPPAVLTQCLKSQVQSIPPITTLTLCVVQSCHKFITDWLNQFGLHTPCLDKMSASGKNRLHERKKAVTATSVPCDATLGSCGHSPAASR